MHLFLGLYWHSRKSYDALAKHLRFEHMDAHYVGNMLANCPNLGKSDLFPNNRGLPPGEAE